MSETMIRLEIGGMNCDHCVMRVQKALASVAGVATATVDLKTASAVVTLDPGKATPEALISAVDAAGYTARVAE